MPSAFVVTTGSLTPEEATRFVAEHVAPYKKVRVLEIIDEIPKSPSGKPSPLVTGPCETPQGAEVTRSPHFLEQTETSSHAMR